MELFDLVKNLNDRTLMLSTCGNSSHKPITEISSMGKMDSKPLFLIDSLIRNGWKDEKETSKSVTNKTERKSMKLERMHVECCIQTR
jgi:hypothetical protein